MLGFFKKLVDKKRKDSKMIFDVASDILKKYEIKEVLGKGGFSTVHLGVNLATGEHVAVKVINKKDIDTRMKSLRAEVSILASISHSNIVTLRDIFEDKDSVYLIMDLMMGGELFSRICNDYPMGYSETTGSKIIRSILEALQYLHSKGIIHRDLKPENILYATPAEDSEIKLSDFGLAKIYQNDIVVRTACGSPNYVAPEVLLDQEKGYTFSVDIWSTGVITYVLLCGFCPFFSDNTSTLFNLIIKGSFSFPSPYWDYISEDAKDFIRHLLDVNCNTRYTATQALSHRWITQATSTAPIQDIQRSWAENSGKRGTSASNLELNVPPTSATSSLNLMSSSKATTSSSSSSSSSSSASALSSSNASVAATDAMNPNTSPFTIHRISIPSSHATSNLRLSKS